MKDVTTAPEPKIDKPDIKEMPGAVVSCGICGDPVELRGARECLRCESQLPRRCPYCGGEGSRCAC